MRSELTQGGEGVINAEGETVKVVHERWARGGQREAAYTHSAGDDEISVILAEAETIHAANVNWTKT